jgi:YVTN family beta-propeller protein
MAAGNQSFTMAKLYMRFLLFVFLFPFFIWNCTLSGLMSSDYGLSGFSDAVEQGPKISIFLNLKNASGPAITMKVASVDILADDLWVPLVSDAFEIDTRKIAQGQFFVGRATVSTGEYKKIRFVIEMASLLQNGVARTLSVQQPQVEIRLSNGLQLGDDDSKTILVSFDTESSIVNSAEFQPALSVKLQADPFLADLAYVACPLINTLYLVRTDTNQVTGSIGVSGRPTYIGIDQVRNRLYVLAADESAIKIIEISSNRILDRIQIPLMSKPIFMALSSDGLLAYIIDDAGQSVLRIDLADGSLTDRARLGDELAYLVAMPDQNLLAISSGISNEVLLLDPEHLTAKGVIPVGSSPEGLLIKDDLLYIAEYGSDAVTVYDLYNRKVRRRLTVGDSPKRLLDADSKIYVSHANKGLVSVINSGLLNVSKEVAFDGVSSEMAYSEKRRRLYVGDTKNSKVVVIDTTSNRVEGVIDIDTMPLGMAVVQ